MIVISKDKSKLDIAGIHSFLTTSYWAKERTIEEVKKTIETCLCFGVYKEDIQIGFVRVSTDYVVFAYIMDVFVLPEYRGEGYSKKLMDTVIKEEELKACKTWMLKTANAHNLYKNMDLQN